MTNDFITDWDEFWDIYIANVKADIGSDFELLISRGQYKKISTSLTWMTTEEMKEINDIIRKVVQIPKKISLIYDPGATTFYSKFDVKSKKYQIAYPTFTKYMRFWEPAMKFAFRHELGHIIRGDCTQNMGAFHNVENNNLCMDIRINGVLDRQGHIDTLCCLLYSLTNYETGLGWGETMNVPEVIFPTIDLDWDEDVRYIPTWPVISDAYSKAENEKRKEQEGDEGNEGDDGEDAGEGEGEGEGEGQGRNEGRKKDKEIKEINTTNT